MKTAAYIFFTTALSLFFYGKTFAQRSSKLDSINGLLAKKNPDSTAAKLMVEKGKILMSGSPDSAVVYFKKVLLFREENVAIKKQKAKALNNLAILLMNLNQTDSSLFYFGLAVKYKRELDDFRGMIGSLNNRAVLYEKTGRYDLALASEKEALSYVKKADDKRVEITILTSIGETCTQMGDFSSAIGYFLQRLKRAEELNDPDETAMGNIQIANVYLFVPDLKTAFSFYQKAMNGIGKFKKPTTQVMVQINTANYYKAVNDRKKAEEMYLAAEDWSKKYLPSALDYVYSNLGTLYADEGKYDKAGELLRATIEIRKKKQNPAELAVAYIMYGEILMKNKKYKSAIENALPGTQLAGQIGAIEKQRLGAQVLKISYLALGDYKNAQTYTEMFYTLNDSMFNSSRMRDMNKSLMQFEFDKKEAIQKIKKEKDEMQSREAKKRDILIRYILIGAFAVLAFVFVIIFRSLQQKKKANKIIEEQKKEVELQKNFIEIKQKEVLDSIRYAKRIQNALLTSEKYIERKLKELAHIKN